MFRRTRFQNGSLTKEQRQKQAGVWVYRWREMNQDGKPKRRKVIVGTVDEYRTESHAKKALAILNLNINQKQSDGSHPALMTMGQLIDHYKAKELGEDRHSKTRATVDVYHEYLKYWVGPQWKSFRVSAVKPTEVEAWLHSLVLADGTKAKIRNIMSAVFQHGLRHQFISSNPIRGLVRQSAKRQREPDVLAAKEIQDIIKLLSPFHRTMVFVAAATGLRFSELRGLQWGDVDFTAGALNLRRGVVKNHVTEMKNKASRKPVPLHPSLVESLLTLRATTAYNQPSDWVFASVKSKGKVPVWPSSLMSDHILPAVKAAKIEKHVSWHVFRGSYATLLKANGEDVKVVQESLRHSTFQVTMDSYTQAVPEAVRSAHTRVVEQLATLINTEECTVGPIIGPELDPGSAELALNC
jgi:integrase